MIETALFTDMRLQLGPPPSSGIMLGPAWNALREPGPWAMQALAIPIGAAFAFAVFCAWARYAPMGSSAFDASFRILVVMSLLVAVHEALHALAHPSCGLTRKSVVGFWPSRLLFYAHYDGRLSRNRLIFIFSLPTLVLTLLPLLLASAFQIRSGWLLFVSCVNALLASADIFGVLLLAIQVPAAAAVRNQGYRTYWRRYPGKT